MFSYTAFYCIVYPVVRTVSVFGHNALEKLGDIMRTTQELIDVHNNSSTLSPETVRNLYDEMLSKVRSMCQKRMGIFDVSKKNGIGLVITDSCARVYPTCYAF